LCLEDKKRRGFVFKKLPKCEYFRPGSFAEAIKILKNCKGKIRPLGGAMDLFIAMKKKRAAWENVLDLKGIPDYDFIRKAEDRTKIGALATIRSVEVSPVINKKIPILALPQQQLGLFKSATGPP
jgi:CO/xanthine dehydrogenase FAD-binding subunit